MRKFKLLKDLPDCPKGAIGREEAYDVVMWEGKDGITQYNMEFILLSPDWFEEVVEKCERCNQPLDCHTLGDCKPTPKKIEPLELLNYATSLLPWGEIEIINRAIITVNEMRGAV